MKTKKNDVINDVLVADEVITNDEVKTEEVKTHEVITQALDEKIRQSLIADATKRIDDLKTELNLAKLDLAKLVGSNKPAGKAGPGVIATIFTLVHDAPVETGITKKDILAKLIEMFPERSSDGMEKTINVQLPKRMSKERDVKIIKTEVGGFVVTK
jgi:hypothetical protein